MAPVIVVEFYGIARLRSGVASLRVTAETVRQALDAVQRLCPGLGCLLGEDGRIHSAYLISVNGRHFTAELSRSLESGDHLVILGADAGG
ncbi:MAG: MoaD/ThiS family protein [Gemmatales bacterium]|nr:MoaD/ThiS family protein [Gemmatales bacterium]MDW8387665.1 MoaD/ThiS family protein [Gemmatales bacterium]